MGSEGEFVGTGDERDGGSEGFPVAVPASGVGEGEGADFFAVHTEEHFAGAFGVVLGVVDDELGFARDAVVSEGKGDGGIGAGEVGEGVADGVLFDLGTGADFGGLSLEEGGEFFGGAVPSDQ